MAIKVQCGKCAKRYTAPDKLAGRRVKCPQCGAVVSIPAPVADPAPLAPLADLLDEELTSGPAIPTASVAPTPPASSPFAAAQPAAGTPRRSNRPIRRKSSSSAFRVSPRALAVLITLAVVLLLALFVPEARLFLMSTLIIVGALLLIVAGLWGIGVAFTEDILCGLMYLFIPFYALYYLLTRWPEMRKPFFVSLSGFGLCLMALMIVVGLGIGGSSFGPRGLPTTGDPTQPLPVSSAGLPSFPSRGTPRTLAPGVDFTQVSLGVRSGEPGQASTLYIYTPPGKHPTRSLPCVLIAPAGAPVFAGMGLASEDRAEHIPYVQEGFAVVAYEIDGQLHGEANRAARRAYDQFSAAQGGLVNARNALAQLPQLSSQKPCFLGSARRSLHYIWVKLFSAGGGEAPACGVVWLGVRSAG